MPNGNSAPSIHIGTFYLTKHLVLKNVLFVLAFHFNLISVSKICTNNKCILKFLSHTCEFQNLSTEKILDLDRAHHGLYYWTPAGFLEDFFKSNNCNTNNKESHCNININKNSFIFHQRLSHASVL